MDDEDVLADATYQVVINHEEQYSIWLDGREIPRGWRAVGKSGRKAECLDYINEVWTDMRPLSLRKKMEEMRNNPPAEPAQAEVDSGPSLVERLAAENHPVEIALTASDDVTTFRECLERNYIHVKFPETRGGTVLGINLDKDTTAADAIDFAGRSGRVHLVGNLTLDYVRCRCVADIELATFKGTGRLEILENAG